MSAIGFGAFKIGRNQAIKYPQAYELPTDDEVDRLLNGALDLGINYIDTAPAYGTSEERIGRAIAHRRSEFFISSKVGETFQDGHSSFDFSGPGVRRSIQHSLRRLQTDVIDIAFIHSSGDDLKILDECEAAPALVALRDAGVLRAIGFSGKTVEGAHAAILGGWADAIMVEYHMHDTSHAAAMELATARGVGVVVKKGLASGALSAPEAIAFVLSNPNVTSMVIGGLNLDHLRTNVQAAEQAATRV